MIYKTIYGNQERRLKPNGSFNVTRSLDRDDSGVWRYRRELDEFTVYGDDYAYFRDIAELDVFSCQDITLEVYKVCDGQRQHRFRGLFTARSIEFNHKACSARIKAEADDDYKCLLESWEKEVNILNTPNPVTVIESNPLYFYQGYWFNLEFLLSNPDGDNDPFPPSANGWHPQRTTGNFPGVSGDQYVVWYRWTFVQDCQAGSPPPTENWLGVIEDNCATDGTVKIAIINNPFTNSGVPAAPFNVSGSDFITATDQAQADDLLALFPLWRQLDNPIGTDPIIFRAEENESFVFSNGRNIEDVLTRLITDECPDITYIKSDLFQINSTATDTILTDNGLVIDFYKYLTIFQTSDIVFSDADQDATRGIMQLRDLLRDFYRFFRTAWSIETDVNGDKFFQIEHESFYSEAVGQDFIAQARNYFVTESLKDEFPLRETFSALYQNNLDFVGEDIEYQSNCVGDEKEVNQVRLFITDYPFLISTLNSDDVPLDNFVLLNAYPYGPGGFQDFYIRVEEGVLTGIASANIGLSWSWLHPIFHRHERPVSNFLMNGSPSQALSLAPNRRTSFRAFAECGDEVDVSKLLRFKQTINLRVNEFTEDLARCRIEVRGDY